MSGLSHLQLRGFRCFGELRYEPGPGLNFLTGLNAQGKTSVLEAACMLLRLRSPRTSSLSDMVRFGGDGFAIEGMMGDVRMNLSCTPPSRQLRLDGVNQSGSSDYLRQGSIVWFGNEDLSLVNGPAERRRRLLDNAGLQIPGTYGRDLRDYERALRSRNLLLREGRSRREIEAYDHPLCECGDRILIFRAALVEDLAPLAAASCRAISGEALEMHYRAGAGLPMIGALTAARSEEIRLRQTRVGPQRDDVELLLGGIPAGSFASEGQRRTVALALKLAVAALLHARNGKPPLLLLDDIFGELDHPRREALLRGMPPGSQALLTTADMGGISPPPGSLLHRLDRGVLSPPASPRGAALA